MATLTLLYINFQKNTIPHINGPICAEFEEMLTTNRIKDMIRLLRESSYEISLLIKIVEHYYNNSKIDYIHDDIIIKIKCDKTIGIIYNIIARMYEINNDETTMAKYLLMSTLYNNSNTANNLGIYYVSQKEYDKATIFFKLSMLHGNQYGIYNLLNLNLLMQNYDEFYKNTLHVSKLYIGNSYKICLFFGFYFQYINKNPIEMFKWYNLNKPMKPDLPSKLEIIYNIGQYYESINDNQNMIKQYLLGEKLRHENSIYKLGNYNLKIKNYNKMFYYGKKILQMNMNHSLAMEMIGKYYLLMNRITDCIALFKKAIILGNVNALNILVIAYYIIKDYKNCIIFGKIALDNNVAISNHYRNAIIKYGREQKKITNLQNQTQNLDQEQLDQNEIEQELV